MRTVNMAVEFTGLSYTTNFYDFSIWQTNIKVITCEFRGVNDVESLSSRPYYI